MCYLNFFTTPSEIPIFFRVSPCRIAIFLGPPAGRISFTYFVHFVLQKVQKYHPPAESPWFPDYPLQNHKKIQTTPTWIF